MEEFKQIKFGKIISEKLGKLIENPKSELKFTNNFELLIAVMLSAQCTDKRVNMVTEKLFHKYKTPKDFADMTQIELEQYIKSCNFFRNKAKNIIEMSKILIEKYNGQVPSKHEQLVALPGVGNKTANVVEIVGFDIPAFPVDTHVLRVSNRLGLVCTKNPNVCEEKLKEIFPKQSWSEMHHLILLFGRYYCKAISPKCNGCVFEKECKYRNEMINNIK